VYFTKIKMPSTSSPPQKKVAKAIVPYSTNQIAYFLSQQALKQMKNDCIIKFGVMRRHYIKDEYNRNKMKHESRNNR